MNLPNILTLVRIALVPIFFSFLLQTPTENHLARFHAFLIFSFGAVTDALDGFFARLLKQQSKLGAFLDPLADKLLILAGFLGILLTTQPIFKLPVWIQVVVLFREIIIALGFLTLFLFSGKMDFKPNWIGKITTFFQMALIISCILNWSGAILIGYFAAVLTIVSGVVYTMRELPNFQRGFK